MPFLELKSHRIHYEVVPQIVPQDCIFLHGNLASNSWWKPLLMELIPHRDPVHRGRAVFMEWRGCGQSTLPAEEKRPLQIEKLGEDVLSLIDYLQLNQTTMVGHSTGGLIGLMAATLSPKDFAKFLFLDTVSARGVHFPPEFLEVFSQMKTSREVCANVMAGTIHQVDTSTPLFKEIVDDAFGVAPQIWHGIPQELENIDLTERLAQLKQPAKVLHGEFDKVLAMDGSRELAKLLPNAQFLELKGSGHSINVENPKMLAEILNAFLMQ